MDNVDDLKNRIDRTISELKELIKLFEMEIADRDKTVSFRQVKEIEESIERLQRQRLPVPEELKELKLKLFSTYQFHEEFLKLYNYLIDSIREINPRTGFQKSAKRSAPHSSPLTESDVPFRKPANYEKTLGRRGYSNLEDYLIPVIKLMWGGLGHNKAFGEIAQKLDVRYNTVSSQCTRGIGLTTDEFIDRVNSKELIEFLKKRYPDQSQIIKNELNK